VFRFLSTTFLSTTDPYLFTYHPKRRSQWPPGLRRGSATARLMKWWVPIPLIAWMCLSLVNSVCCQIEISASGRSLLQRSPTQCGVSECDREASIMRGPWPTRNCCSMKKKIIGLLGQRALPHITVQVLWYSRRTMHRRFESLRAVLTRTETFRDVPRVDWLTATLQKKKA
jgi:hypothetical protein